VALDSRWRAYPGSRMNRDSLLNVAVRRVGVFKGAQAASVIVSWAIAVEDLGHELGADEGGHLTAAVREYAAYWKLHERTAWREHKRFALAFPGEESPARLASVLRRETDVRAASKQDAMALPLAIA
jgi:hypothetical protein